MATVLLVIQEVGNVGVEGDKTVWLEVCVLRIPFVMLCLLTELEYLR